MAYKLEIKNYCSVIFEVGVRDISLEALTPLNDIKNKGFEAKQKDTY